MGKVKEFFGSLKRSTKITLISCVSFVLMTFLILCFFIMSPITPSDKAGHTYGRESISTDTTDSTITTSAAGVDISSDTTGKSTTTVTTTHKDYVITITTGTSRADDYYTDGRINTGEFTGPYNVDPFQATSEQSTQSYTNGYEPVTEYTTGGQEPYTGEDPTEPYTGEITTQEPTQAPTEIVTQAPPQTQPPVIEPTTGGEVSVW
ncbi:MAG: hypothetical protein IKO47_00230 [Ruminococcus sp.]|nr:hypothetical protein [Ruminococcus sp.]